MAHRRNIGINGASPHRRKKHRKSGKRTSNPKIEPMFEYITSDITQGMLYMFAGRTDDVCTLDLREGSEVYKMFGPKVTIELIYTQEERKKLENDSTSLNNTPNVKARGLCFLFGKGKEYSDYLINEGIPVKDITAAFVIHYTPPNNLFTSGEKRSVDVLEVPFDASANGDDIYWLYEFLCRQKRDGIGLMPEYEDEYLACKYILDKEKLTEEENKQIYNEFGRVGNPNIAYHILFWKKAAGMLNEKESRIYNKLKEKRNLERVRILDQELKRIGIPFNKFCKNYPEQAHFVYEKLQTFNDRSFNTKGRFPLYMDFKSFLHIYLRHVDIVNMGNQLAQKDKFQLYEKDVLIMIDHVMRALNDEYQQYREANPEKQFVRKGEKAYYCRGDYYEVYVDKDGRIETLYKASRKGESG